MKNIYKLIKTIGSVLIASSLFLIVSALLILVYIGLKNNNVDSNLIAIIGGADKPTVKFLILQLVSQYRLAIVLILAALIVGICCIIVSAFIRKR